MKKPKICFATSSGAHLIQIYNLKNWWKNYDRFWVSRNDNITKHLLKNEKLYYAHFPENRNIINALKNLLLAMKILRKERPTLVFSTGAGVSPPFMLIAKLLHIKTVFMETFVFINKPTLSGKMMYHLVDLFLVQNKKMLAKYPKAKCWGKTL